MAQSSNNDAAFKCPKCNASITADDWSNNVEDSPYGMGVQHKKCRQTQNKNKNNNNNQMGGFWSKQFVSSQSQYSHQSSGSCTINALETALRLQLGQEPSVKLINDVCTKYLVFVVHKY